jgi:hypothetical protein
LDPIPSSQGCVGASQKFIWYGFYQGRSSTQQVSSAAIQQLDIPVILNKHIVIGTVDVDCVNPAIKNSQVNFRPLVDTEKLLEPR